MKESMNFIEYDKDSPLYETLSEFDNLWKVRLLVGESKLTRSKSFCLELFTVTPLSEFEGYQERIVVPLSALNTDMGRNNILGYITPLEDCTLEQIEALFNYVRDKITLFNEVKGLPFETIDNIEKYGVENIYEGLCLSYYEILRLSYVKLREKDLAYGDTIVSFDFLNHYIDYATNTQSQIDMSSSNITRQYLFNELIIKNLINFGMIKVHVDFAGNTTKVVSKVGVLEQFILSDNSVVGFSFNFYLLDDIDKVNIEITTRANQSI